MNTPLLTVFEHGLSRSAAMARQLLGHGFTGIVVSDRFSAYSWLPLARRQLCWAHLRRDLTAITERYGSSGEIGRELLEQQMFHHWHQWRDGEIDREQLQQHCAPIRQQFEDTLQQAGERSELYGWREDSLGLHRAHLPSDPVRGTGSMELPGDARRRAHQQRRRRRSLLRRSTGTAASRDSQQTQLWRPLRQWRPLPHPSTDGDRQLVDEVGRRP